MSKVEEKIDNLKLTDSKPVKVAEPVIGNKSQDKQPIKQVDKPIEDKNETVESKDKSTNLPTKPQIATQQQTSSSTAAAEPLQKRSSLEGCQSKSDSKNIVYDAEFLKSLQYSNSATKKPNFNQKVEILLNEPRSKHENSLNEFEPQFARNAVSTKELDFRFLVLVSLDINVHEHKNCIHLSIIVFFLILSLTI